MKSKTMTFKVPLKIIPMNPALQFIKQVVETYNLAEVAEKLNSGDWIAIAAAPDGRPGYEGRYLFSLGRVND